MTFISRGALWLIGGRLDRPLRLLPASRHPVKPTFSADGRWLAVTAGPNEQRVWLARSDGADLHELARPSSVVGWSPRGHDLAVDVGAGGTTALTLITPSRGQRVLTRVRFLLGAAWSPTGHALAVSAGDDPKGRVTIRSFPINGGPATTWLSLDNHNGRLEGMNQIHVQVAGWWRHTGIGFWVTGDGMALATDQTPLDLIAHPGAVPRHLADTLMGYTATAVTASLTGRVALVAETRARGFGRLVWQDKAVETCQPNAQQCRRVPAPPGTVTLDPTWSSDGNVVAYVIAPQRSSPAFPQGVLHRWYGQHKLVIDNVTTGSRRVVPNSQGATAPRWSSDGRTLMYEAGNSLWLLPTDASRPVRIATPLYGADIWPEYYGQIDWIGQFAWTG